MAVTRKAGQLAFCVPFCLGCHACRGGALQGVHCFVHSIPVLTITAALGGAGPPFMDSSCSAGKGVLDVLGVTKAHHAPRALAEDILLLLPKWLPDTGAEEVPGRGLAGVKKSFP